MLRVLPAGFIVIFALAGGPERMDAQEQAGQNDYDARALRLESSWGYGMVVRGREGTVIGKVGGLRAPDLATALAPSAAAIREAREFKQRYDRGNKALLVGALALTVGVGLARLDGVDRNVLVPAYATAAAGTALLGYAAVQRNRASSALARSLWWYNRDLRR
jgi:hypothetical protein